MNPRTALVASVVIALLVGALAGYIYRVASTPARTPITTVVEASPDFQQVAGAYTNHLIKLGSRNASTMASQYGQNASITWTGAAAGYAGQYNGISKIVLFLNGSFLRHAVSFATGNVTLVGFSLSNGLATLNSSFDFVGNSTLCGIFHGEISAQDSFVYSAASGTWLISHEVWNFTEFAESFPVPGLC